MILRPATLADAEPLATLAGQTPGAPLWTAATYRDLAVNPLRLLLLLEHDTKPTAFAAAALITPPPSEAELEAIAVHPAAQRQGHGTTLLRAVQHWAAQHQAIRLLLEVRASNLAAQHLYRAHGFLPTGRRRNYYQHPPEDAVLMEHTPAPISGIISSDYGS